ncbi:alpha-1,2-mannosidase [Favolaschia claudopus]|uniref:alpha-1,2-Mannosidase n=1 Tax=Favolaschia claudopus TaxID=2862362 RepID=A0AAW0BGE0_9AGAR
MPRKSPSPYLRFRQNPTIFQILQIFRRRPLFFGLILLAVTALLWKTSAHEYVLQPFTLNPYDFPTNTPPKGWVQRAERVKSAFLHAYHGYEQFAAPHDELLSLSNGSANPFNGWGVTAVDSLDTMLLMKLDDEFSRALKQVSAINFAMRSDKFASFFETVIRYLGGLLSAYAISKDPVLLTRAEELADILDPAFNKYKGVFPVFSVNTTSGDAAGPEIGALAEMASMQVEYLYLAKATGKQHYFERANQVMRTLAFADLHKTGGMLPIAWNLTSVLPFDTRLSVGGKSDSAHEYLLKQYLLTAQTDKKSLEMYIRMTTQVLTTMLYVSPERNLLYVTETSSSTFDHAPRPSHKIDHLSCFFPGLLALGAHLLPLDGLPPDLNLNVLGAGMGWAARGYDALARQSSLREMHLWAAEGLARTCYLFYADQPTGLAPEEISLKVSGDVRYGLGQEGKWLEGGGRRWIDEVEAWRAGTKWKGQRRTPPGVGEEVLPVVYTEAERMRGSGRGRDYVIRQAAYLLRPETVESLYIMWRVTKETRWREMGWRIFEAIEKETRTPSGYACVKTVEVSPALQTDSMPSYFLAETLKYLYLLFLDEEPFPLNTWVFNTEAHPFPVFEWTAIEKERLGIL